VLDNDGPDILDLSTVELDVLESSRGAVNISGGQITYTPPPNAAGQAAILYEICSGPVTCDTATLLIDVTPVKDPTQFAADGEIALPANAGPQLIQWVIVSSGQTSVAPGTTFSISTDKPGLFSTQPSISSTGNLSFEPQPGAAGTASTVITVSDNAGTRSYRLKIIIG